MEPCDCAARAAIEHGAPRACNIPLLFTRPLPALPSRANAQAGVAYVVVAYVVVAN